MNKKHNPVPDTIYYREGGNPPDAPGLFDHHGNRLAWWPAGYPVTRDAVHRVHLLIEGNPGRTLSREEVRDLLNEMAG